LLTGSEEVEGRCGVECVRLGSENFLVRARRSLHLRQGPVSNLNIESFAPLPKG